LLLRLNNFIQPVGQLPGDGFNEAELMSLPASHDFAFAFRQIGGGGLGHGHGRVTFSDWSWPDHVRGQIMSVASSRSRPIHGHGLAVLVSMIADTA
jgi:hypothetical protein